MRAFLCMLLLLAFVTPLSAASNTTTTTPGTGIMHYPNGLDSIGIPDEPYRGTCFQRCERVQGYTVKCDVAQRIAFVLQSNGTFAGPVDCATHCSYALVNLTDQTFDASEYLTAPLPEAGVLRGYSSSWRHAQHSWCHLLRGTDGVIYYPSCHAENYQD